MKEVGKSGRKIKSSARRGTHSGREDISPLSISPEVAFRLSCWSAWEVWEALTTGKLPHHSVSIADLRGKPLYRVLFAFFYQLQRIDSLDDALVQEAVLHIRHKADRCLPWDGGKEIRDSWSADWDRFMSSITPEAMAEWAAKYLLVHRSLFAGPPTDPGVVEQALRAHADFYLEKVLNRCMNVEFFVEGDNPDDFTL
jgi:hypothetical protein